MAIRVGIIGVGKAGPGTWEKGGGHKIGYLHADSMLSVDGFELVAAADISQENLSAFCQQHPGVKGFSDHLSMLGSQQLDMVCICTYLGLHAAMVHDAIDSGVPAIMCEKPFVRSPAELLAVEVAASESGAKIALAHFRRYRSCVQEARRLIGAGAIGAPITFFGGLPGWDLSEFGSHWIDLIRFLHGDKPVADVMGQVSVREGFGYGHSMEELGLVHFRFSDGARAIVDGGVGFLPVSEIGEKRSGPVNDIFVVGSDGMLVLNEAMDELMISDGKGRRRLPVPESTAAWPAMYADVKGWLVDGKAAKVALEKTYATAEVNLAAYASAWRRDVINLPFDSSFREDHGWALDRWKGVKSE